MLVCKQMLVIAERGLESSCDSISEIVGCCMYESGKTVQHLKSCNDAGVINVIAWRLFSAYLNAMPPGPSCDLEGSLKPAHDARLDNQRFNSLEGFRPQLVEQTAQLCFHGPLAPPLGRGITDGAGEG